MVTSSFTPSQDRAIHCINKNVSVSAGAGSGKTSVLVQRFLYLLSSGIENPDALLLPRDIMAVTFTRKAAAEMYDRIRNEIEAGTRSGNNRDYWRLQKAGLPQAQIGTIHSFCAGLLRANPVESELDPAFVVLEENENNEFLEKEVQGCLRRLLHEGDEDASLLCKEYGSKSLLEQTLVLLKKGIAFSREKETGIYEDIIKETRQTAEQLKTEFTPEFVEACSAGNRKVLENNLDAIRAALSDITAPGSLELLEKVWSGLAKRGKNSEEAGSIKDRLAFVVSCPLNLKASGLVTVWKRYLAGVQASVRNKKMELGVLAFDDLEEMALELLDAHPEVLKQCRRQFRYIMVDEFQDTNERQRQLIYLLCGGNKNRLLDHRLFVVGDPKQSIYRFRGADVSVFARVRNEIEKTGGEVIELNDNFRTVGSILQLCNCVFPCMMGTDCARDVFYKELQFHRKNETIPELGVFHYSEGTPLEEARRKEAGWLSLRLKALHQEGMPYQNMAILLQNMTHVSVLTEALGQSAVPYAVVDGRGFYDRTEIQDLINLFLFVVNPDDNLNLAGVLRSVYMGMDDASLTILHLALDAYQEKPENGISLWEFLQEGNPPLGQKQKELLQRDRSVLGKILAAGTVLNLPDFCRELRKLLRPEPVLAMQHGGNEQIANLRKFFRLASEFAVKTNGTVRDFALRLEQLKKNAVREAAADVETDDAVLVMTVHKSKGLEFPLVSIPFMEIPLKNDTNRIAYHKETGLGISVQDDRGTVVASEGLKRIRGINREQEREEKVRLLYVAMTRARDRLILSGCLKDGGKKSEAGEDHWLNGMEKFLPKDYTGIRRSDFIAEKISCTEIKTVSVPPEAACSPETAARLIAQTAPLKEYGESGITGFSASSLAEYDRCQRRYYYQMIENIPPLEEKGTPGGKLPAAVMGTLIHEVLEKYYYWRKEHGFSEDEQAWRDLFAGAVNIYAAGKTELAAEAEKILSDYLRSGLYREFSKRQWMAEQPFRLSLLQDDTHDYVLTGFIDAVAERDDGMLEIIDYKSGKTPQTGTVQRGYAWQLTLYKMAAEKLFRRKVAKACLHFLRDQSEWVLPEGSCTEEIKKLCREISGKKREEDFLTNPAHCAFCPFSYMCKK